MKAGIQLSSFSPLMQDESGLEAVLSAMSGFGCRLTQVQWIAPSVPVEKVSELLRRYCIFSVGVQDKSSEIFACPEYYTALAGKCDIPEICISGISEAFETYIEKLRALMECSMAFSYHPTRGDLADNALLCDRLLNEFPKLRLCADVCQLNDAGINPIEFIRRYEVRIDTVHFKDRNSDGKLCVVGEGITDFRPIAAVCRDAGVKYLLAEQESHDGDPIECLKRGYLYTCNCVLNVN